MKKLTLTFAFLLLAVLLIGQDAGREFVRPQYGDPSSTLHKASGKQNFNYTSYMHSTHHPLVAENTIFRNAELIVKQKLDSVIGKEWNENTGLWDNSTKMENSYDAYGNNDQFIIREWDNNTEKWLNSWKTESDFLPSGQMERLAFYEWNIAANQWLGNFEEVYSYDLNGNLTETIYYEWDEAANQWVINNKDELIYNFTGQLILANTYEWDETANEWVIESKSEYTYDGGNETQINSRWDAMSNQWVYTNKIERSYNSNGFRTLEVGYSWDGHGWEAVEKYESVYLEEMYLIFENAYYWEFNAWILDSKEEFVYDDFANCIHRIGHYRDELTNELHPYWKVHCSYNNDYDLDDLIYPWATFLFDPSEMQPKHMQLCDTTFIAEDGSWTQDESRAFFYSEINLGIIEEQPYAILNVYPNPFNNSLHIEFELGRQSQVTVSIQNLLGQEVASIMEGVKEKGRHQLIVYACIFPAGIYLLHLETDDGASILKMIKH